MVDVAVPPVPLRVPITDEQGLPTLIFREWLERMFKRAGGAGTVTIVISGSPLSSTDNAAARFNGTDGGNIQNSGVVIDDGDNMTVPGMVTLQSTLSVTSLATLLAGAAVTGNITVTGTVDGRDIATDGTKLDGIEAGAEVNDVDTVFGRVGAVVAVDGDYDIGQVSRALESQETTAGQAALASAGTVTVFDSAGSETWKVREIYLSGEGTNFSGGGGDRDLEISEGSTIFTVIPAATLQALAAARWGDTGVPFPATAAHFTTATSAGGDILAQYSGGTTDYSAGQLKVVVIAERIS